MKTLTLWLILCILALAIGDKISSPSFTKAAETTVAVNSTPTGPSGSWHVAFADGFGKPVGGGDTFWKAHSTSEHPAGWKGCCNNSEETASENPLAVHWSEANGLELRCEGLVCSGVSTTGFTYQLGRGATFAIEVVAKLPNNSIEGEDPGAWSKSTFRWPPEFDWFEYWGWGCTTNCIGGFPVYKSAGVGSHELDLHIATILGAQPWEAFHRYTTVVEGTVFTEYIDGKRIGSFSQAVEQDTMKGILTHALRVSTVPRNTSFDVRSVAVYEDAAHAGQFVSGGGIAPGTTEGTITEPPKEDPDKAQDETAEAAGAKAITAAETTLREAKAALVAIKADS